MTGPDRYKLIKNIIQHKKSIFVIVLFLLFIGGGQRLSAADGRQGTPLKIADTIIVAKDGSGNFTSIQKAIESAKSYSLQPVVVFIKKGIYEEQISVPAWNPHIRLIGEGPGETIIRFGSYFGAVDKGRNSTFYTATMRIEAEDVVCRHLTIENTAGPVGQAIALSVSADKCLIEDCRLAGNQDTFFATGSYTRVYLKDCEVSGTTDFLFGDATVFLSRCSLLCKADSYIVAASTAKGRSNGFVLDSCTIRAAPGVKHVFLGRPWRPYAQTVYLNTLMGDFIAPLGWDNWRSKENESTAYYAEYNSKQMTGGSPVDLSKRAAWAHSLQPQEAEKYTPGNILGSWIHQPL